MTLMYFQNNIQSSDYLLANEDGKVAVWNVRPFQIVSLLEMLEHNANLFYFTTRQLQRLQTQIEKAIEDRKGDSLLIRREVVLTQRIIRRIRHQAEPLRLVDVLHRLNNFPLEQMQSIVEPWNLYKLKFELEELSKQIAKSLCENLFMMIPTDKAVYYDQPDLFGRKVHRNFKSTRDDVKETGNCYATGQYTACVFHCMRVLEKGLHVLVSDLNQSFNTNINFPKGIEAISWGNIIEKTEKEIDELLRPRRKPPLTKNDLRFYSKAVTEFTHFQKAWRDDVAHSLSDYDENEAKAVMEHVKAFMQHLVTRLKE